MGASPSLMAEIEAAVSGAVEWVGRGVLPFPDSVPAQTINRFCSSGLQAIANVAVAIHSGIIDVGVAGGVESMTMVPMSGNKVSLHPGLVDNRPLLLMAGPEVLDDHLRQARISRGELFGQLRSSGVLRLEQVTAVVLETTVDLSVLTGDDDVDQVLLAGVRGSERLR